MSNTKASPVLRAALAGSLLTLSLLLGGCADSPRKSAVPPAPPAPLTNIWVVREAHGALKVCLRKQAFALDNGKRSVNTIAAAAFAGCYPQINDYLMANAHRTRDPRAQLTLARGALRQARSLALKAAEHELAH